MKVKMSGALLIALLFSVSIHAQQNYRVEPSPWAFSWGVGLGTMVPTGDLGNKFNAGFAADTELNLYYNKAFLMLNGGFAMSGLVGDIDVVSSEGNTVWPGDINRILKMGLRYQFQKPNHEKEQEGFAGATHWLTLRFVIGSSMPGKKVYY